MPSAATKRRLSEDVGTWLLDGLISADTAAVLRERYSAADFGFATVIRYLGISGGLLALLGLLGAGVALTGSEGLGGFVTAVVGVAVVGAGLWLSDDLRSRYGTSSKVVLALGVAAVAVGIALIGDAANVSKDALPMLVGALVVPALFFLAYRYRNPFLLVEAVAALFAWIGAAEATSGGGRSDRFVELSLAAAGLCVFGFGVWHERALERRGSRFFVVYQSLGLLALDGALYVLSLDDRHDDALLFMGLFGMAVIGQLALGARLRSGLILAFGLTTGALELCTRYFETFWDKLDRGLFFLLGGALLFAVGFGLERLLRKTAVPA